MDISKLKEWLDNVDNQFNETIIKPIGKWLDQHTLIHTIVVVANHIFRAVAMYAFINILPYTLLTNCILSLGASIFYRITIERHCHFRFAIPSCLGGMAMYTSLPYLTALIQGVAFQTLSELAKTFVGVIPLTLYLLGVVWISYDAVLQLSKGATPCCSTS